MDKDSEHLRLREVFGGLEKFQTDPHWRDYILFHEYFHGDKRGWNRREPSNRQDGPRGDTHPALQKFQRLSSSQGGEGRGFIHEGTGPRLTKKKIAK